MTTGHRTGIIVVLFVTISYLRWSSFYSFLCYIFNRCIFSKNFVLLLTTYTPLKWTRSDLHFRPEGSAALATAFWRFINTSLSWIIWKFCLITWGCGTRHPPGNTFVKGSDLNESWDLQIIRAAGDSLKGKLGLAKKFGIIEASEKDLDTERKRNKSWYAREHCPFNKYSMFLYKILAEVWLHQKGNGWEAPCCVAD